MAAHTRIASIHEELEEWAEENFDPENILSWLNEAISTAMTKIKKRIVKTISNLIGKYQVIPKGILTLCNHLKAIQMSVQRAGAAVLVDF